MQAKELRLDLLTGLGRNRLKGLLFAQALKNFLAVVKHFAVFKEDQFDFHTYCMRKTTLRNYVNMLRMEDTILENPNYAKVQLPLQLVFTYCLIWL